MGGWTLAEEQHAAVIDVRATFQQGFRDVAIQSLPPLLLPRKGRFGLRNYEKVFAAALKSGRDIFALGGIDRQRGFMIVVRPDQYVAHVLSLDATGQLTAYFDGFMMEGAGQAALRAVG